MSLIAALSEHSSHTKTLNPVRGIVGYCTVLYGMISVMVHVIQLPAQMQCNMV